MEEKTATTHPDITPSNVVEMQLARPQTQLTPWTPQAMTEERRQFLKKQFLPSGASDVEFEYFVSFCARTGLDPVLKQAFMVERRAQVDGNWITKYEPMAATAGFEARADALPDFRGMLGGVVYQGDEFAIDYAECKVIHRSSPLTRGKLVGAWAHIQREGRRVRPTFLRVEERMQVKRDGTATSFWAKMTATMIQKCAEAEQYRKGYGNIFGGAYIREEFNTETGELITYEEDGSPTGQVEQDNRPTADKLEQRLKAEKEAQKPKPAAGATITVEPVKQPAKSAPTNVKPTQTTPTSAAVKAAGGITSSEMDRADKAGPAPVDEGPLMNYGQQKGTPISKLTGPQILDNISLGEQKISTLTTEKQIAAVRATLDALRAQAEKNDAALLDDAPEPGSAG